MVNNWVIYPDGKPYSGKTKTTEQDFSGESLFTGDVAFSVPITSVGGVTISLNYNSNIQTLVKLSNSVQQAGWVGLGWTLELGSIKADINGTRDVNDDKYYFVSSTGTSELIHQSGNDFILKEYNYWKFERQIDNNNLVGWKITTDNGTIIRFGNYDKSSGAFLFNATLTKATRFLLGWDGIITNALNIYYSNAQLISYQWDVSDVEDIFHNHTTINYYQELDYIFSQFYSSTLQFTQASYPESIVDQFGNKVQFNLANLTVDEYPVNPGGVGVDRPIQVLYQTKYLQALYIKNESGTTIQTIELDYETEDVLDIDCTKRYLTSILNKDINNVEQPKTIIEYFGVSEILPLNPIVPEVKNATTLEFFGALKSIEYPTGSKVEYEYTAQAITNVTLDQDLLFDGTAKPIMPPYDRGLSGIDFYAVKMSDNLLKVYRWGTNGWYEDLSFPVTGEVYGYWVANDYIVYNQDVMKVVKRKGDGWTTPYTVSASAGSSPGSLAVISAQTDFFVLRHNVIVHSFGFLYLGTEDVSVVKWNDNSWTTQFIGQYKLGQLPNDGQPIKELEAVCGIDYFIVKTAVGDFDEYASRCVVVTYSATQWDISANIDVHNLPNEIWFGLYGGKDYFLTWQVHESNPNIKNIYIWHWPFSAGKYSQHLNEDASHGIFCGDNFFVKVGESDMTIRTYNGDGRTGIPAHYTYTNLASLLNIPIGSIQNATVAPGKNSIVIGWVEQNGSTYCGKVALVKFEDGEWVSGGIIDTYDNLNDMSRVRVFNNPENIFAEIYIWGIETKLVAYNKTESGWNLTELVDVDQLGGSYPISSLSAAGVNFVSDIVEPGTQNDLKYVHSRMKAYNQNVDLKFQGNPYDFPVTKKTVTNGMGDPPFETTFTYANGIFDETLNFAKYNKVTLTPPGNIGRSVTYFYNDLGASQCEEFVSVTNFKELDGIPYKVKIYGMNNQEDLDPVSTTTNTYSVVNIDAANGVYHKRLIKTENWIDGITNTIDYEYNNTNGQINKITEPVKVTSDLYDLRDRVTEVTFAYSQYPAMQTSNMLNQVYEKKIFSVGNSSAMCTVFAEAEDLTDYNQFTVTYNQKVTYTAVVNGGYFCVGTTQGGEDVLTKKYSNSNGSFQVTAGVIYYLTAHTYQCPPYHPCENTVNGRVTYRLSNDPDDAIISQERTEYDANKYPFRTTVYDGTNWMVKNTVTGRNSLGQVIESQNIDGLFSTVKLGHNNQAAIGNIFNAKNSETCIADFEDNSEGEWDDWTVGGGIGNAARTGSKGWHFNFGEAGVLTKHFLASDINTSGKYILSGWIKSSSQNPGILQWYVKWVEGDDVHSTYPATVLATGGGDWEYLELPIDLHVYPDLVEIFVYAQNHNGTSYSECDWDDLKFYPQNALINATTYDPVTLNPTSTSDLNSVTTYTEYDDFGRLVETRNDDGLVVSESNYFSSVDKFGLFNSAYPNSVTQKVFSNGNPVRNASFELGLTGTEPKGWTLNTRCTVTTNKDAHTGSYSMKVVSNGNDAYVHNYLYSNKYLKKNTQYKISFWAKNNGGSSSVEAFLMKVNDAGTYTVFNNVAINVSSTTWQRYEGAIVLDGNSEWDNLYNNSVLRLDINTSGQIVYFDDIQIEEGNILHLPITSIAFLDGLGKSIQSQLWDGNNDIISGVDYDIAGRTWKSFIPYSSSSTAHLYDTNFASHSTGYAETQYFRDPLSRVNVSIEPGSSPYTPDKNTESTYGNSTVNGQLCYTSDIKQKQATNSTNWITTRQYKNKLGNVIKSTVLDGTTEIQSSTTLYNMNGQPVKTTDPRGLESTITYDGLGKIKSGTSPDAGTTKYIYDQSGRMRFMIDAEGLNASPNNVLYLKYDIYGRVIEKGYINTIDWGDGSILQNYANTNDSWPPTPFTWRKKFTYDVEGVAPYMKGRLYKVETNNNNDVESEVEETFIYNKYGAVITKNLEVKDFDNQIYSTSYEYDDAGRVNKINYPSRPTDLTLQNETLSGITPYLYEASNTLTAGPSLLINTGTDVIFKAGSSVILRPGFTAPNGCSFRAYTGTFTGGTEPTEVIYTYNNLGQVSGVGTTSNPNEYASYTYNASGKIQNENFNNGQRQVQISYDINGRPTQITSPLFTENLTYETGGYGGVGYYHGLIASTGFTYYAGGPTAYQTQFLYDNLGRLKIADIVNNSSLNAYDITNISYDLNSNITSLTKGTTTKNYAYYTQTNKVQNTDGSGNDYSYDANGNIVISTPRSIPSIDYDPFTQMTMGMTITDLPDRTMMFRYSGDNARVLKSETYGTTNNSNLYIRGNNEYPLTEKIKVGTNINDKIYIYGPTGLIAIKTSNETYYALKDHLGSTRILFEGSTNIAVSTYDYQPFGGLLRATINEDVRYRFTGQEFDGETGLWNFRARMYDDELGIFYAVDPSGQGFSPFGYCGNNPIMYTDPTGMLFGIDDAIIFGIFAGGIFGGVSAQANHVSFLEGFFKGAIVGGLGGLLAPIGGAGLTFTEDVLLGAGEGMLTGLLNSVMWNSDIGDGLLYGGISGAIFAAANSEYTKNWVRGAGFNSNSQVFDNMMAGSMSCQEIIDYFGFEGNYNPNQKPPAYVENGEGYYGTTDPLNGDILYGDLAFDSFDRLHQIYLKENFTSKRVLNGEQLNQEIPKGIPSYFKVAPEEAEGFIYAYRNNGLYPSIPVSNFVSNIHGYQQQIFNFVGDYFEPSWWHFIYRIPRRF
jgi:RHS repeat-associated protein